MFQIVDGSGTDAVLIDQRIGSNLFLCHGFPQRFIADHSITHFLKDTSIIFCKLGLYYTENCNYNKQRGVIAMDRRLSDLYTLADPQEQQDLYLLELRDHCARLEYQLLEAAEQQSFEWQMMIEGYIAVRDELDFQSVRAALRFAKKKGAV